MSGMQEKKRKISSKTSGHFCMGVCVCGGCGWGSATDGGVENV